MEIDLHKKLNNISIKDRKEKTCYHVLKKLDVLIFEWLL